MGTKMRREPGEYASPGETVAGSEGDGAGAGAACGIRIIVQHSGANQCGKVRVTRGVVTAGKVPCPSVVIVRGSKLCPAGGAQQRARSRKGACKGTHWLAGLGCCSGSRRQSQHSHADSSMPVHFTAAHLPIVFLVLVVFLSAMALETGVLNLLQGTSPLQALESQ